MNPLSVFHLRRKTERQKKLLTYFNREGRFAPPLTKVFQFF